MLTALTLLAQDYTYTYSAPTVGDPASSAAAGAFMLMWLVITLPLSILEIVGVWKVLSKAGRPGWAALVPVYDMLQILWTVGRPWWWILLLLVPFLNIVIVVIVYNDLAKSFGKGAGMTLLLLFFPFIAYPILGLGSATYQGPSVLKGNSTGADKPDDKPSAPADTSTPPADNAQ